MIVSTFLLRRTQSQIKCTSHLLTRRTSSNVEQKIEIPKRIPRSPTDILRALESTISRDPTAAHYKYHDDPYLIPMSNIGKRTFAMAQEAGRKAAHWIRSEHADLFNHREADPVIEAFLPKMVYNENSKVTEEDLIKTISDQEVSDSQLVYKLLKDQGVTVSNRSCQALLELLCYSNGEDVLSSEYIEERWFKQGTKSKERARKTWKDSNFAEELFISMENPSAESYSALIQGMCKYYSVDRAWQLFEEAQQKGLVLHTNTYNSLISIANFLKESHDMQWSFITNLLSNMNSAGIKPNLGTLNAILYSLSTMGSGQSPKEAVLKVLREFKELGIEPSLGSWYFVLITYCKERGAISTILHDIMTHVENKEHNIRDISDVNFFVTAMDICRNHLRDAELGKRVHKLLLLGNNYNLIGDSYKESIYYRHYCLLMMLSMPLEEFMSQVYDILVPNIYVPEPGVMSELLKQVDLNGAIEYISKLWSDMIIFDHTNRENLIEAISNIMVNNGPETGSELASRFSYIAWDIYSRIENQNEQKTNKIKFTGELLGNIMMLVLRNNDFDKASILMDKLDKGHQTIVGLPKFEALSLFIDQCIDNKTPTKAIACIQYCLDCGFPEVDVLAARLNEKLTLDENHLNNLAKIVGGIDTFGKIEKILKLDSVRG
ncbi:small ribosomal subunit protein mS39 [Leptinotarsa decemlineata]|uniref:small ribosomal subunit protein mS39 n=1 Tax=Leptinotarsa decemlineata TaxID=7539 RepID=UPI003D30556E